MPSVLSPCGPVRTLCFFHFAAIVTGINFLGIDSLLSLYTSLGDEIALRFPLFTLQILLPGLM